MTEDERYMVPALQRGLTLLQAFTRDQKSHTGADLARVVKNLIG